MQVVGPSPCNARLRPSGATHAYRAAPDHGAALPLTGGCCQLGTCGRGRLPSSRARVKIGRQGHRPGNCGAGNGKRMAGAEKAAKAGLGISRKNPVNLTDGPRAPHP